MPINLEDAAIKRWSEAAKLEYQKVRPSATAGEEAPPGLMNMARAIMPMMMRTATRVADRAILELEASLAPVSGAP